MFLSDFYAYNVFIFHEKGILRENAWLIFMELIVQIGTKPTGYPKKLLSSDSYTVSLNLKAAPSSFARMYRFPIFLYPDVFNIFSIFIFAFFVVYSGGISVFDAIYKPT